LFILFSIFMSVERFFSYPTLQKVCASSVGIDFDRKDPFLDGSLVVIILLMWLQWPLLVLTLSEKSSTYERYGLCRWNQFWQKGPIFCGVCNGAMNIVALSCGFSVCRWRKLSSLILLFLQFLCRGKIFLLPTLWKVCFICWNRFWPKGPIFGWISCDNIIIVTSTTSTCTNSIWKVLTK